MAVTNGKRRGLGREETEGVDFGGWASLCLQARIYEIQGQQVALAPTHGTGTQGLSDPLICALSPIHFCVCMFVHGVQVCVRVHVRVWKSMRRSENSFMWSFADSGRRLADKEFTK